MGKDATVSTADLTTDASVLKFDKSVSNFTPNLIEWGAAQGAMQGAMQGQFKQALEAGATALTNSGTLPKCEISGDDKAQALDCNSKSAKSDVVDALNQAILKEKLDHIKFPKIDLEKIGDILENDRNASRAADIVRNSDPHGRDIGNQAEQKELQKMFHEAHDKGPEAVQSLVDSINEKLKGTGMTVDFDANHDPFSLSDGRLEVINEHNQIIKSISIPDPDSIYRKGLN